MKIHTKLALLGMVLVFLVLAVPSVLAVKTGNYSNSINMERGTDGVLVITIEPDTANCGNGILQTAYGEQCDGEVSFTCENLDSTWTGSLSCKSDCTYDTSGCSVVVIPGTTSTGGSGSSRSRSSSSSSNTLVCVENWECEEWSKCENGVEKRVCADLSSCGTAKARPVMSRGCSASDVLANSENDKTDKGFFNSLFTGAVIGNLGTKGLIGVGVLILVLLVALWYVMAKKKASKKK